MGTIERLRIPIWRESRLAAEHAGLRRDPVLRGADLPARDGAPVLLIPGFMAGDASGPWNSGSASAPTAG